MRGIVHSATAAGRCLGSVTSECYVRRLLMGVPLCGKKQSLLQCPQAILFLCLCCVALCCVVYVHLCLCVRVCVCC